VNNDVKDSRAGAKKESPKSAKKESNSGRQREEDNRVLGLS